MSLFAYVCYAFALFAGYISYVLGQEFFIKYALPWMVFIFFLFAPLVWNLIPKDLKK